MGTNPQGRAASSLPRTLWSTFLCAICFFAGLPGARAQKLSPASQVPQAARADTSQSTPKPDAKTASGEIASKDAPSPINVSVNMVLVRVVVRNADGKVIPNLKKDDFQIADNHMPQVISSFSVETLASPASAVKMGTSEASSAGAPVKKPDLPQRFVAVLFDDLFLSTGDATYSRQAATKLLESMQAGDRFALFTTSGLVEQDFTADRAKLDEALQKTSVQQPEPAMGNYPDRLRKLFGDLDALIRRMTALPGPRAIVLVSPGFFETPSLHRSGDIIDQAIKASIVIDAIDVRGLYGPPGNVESNHPSPGPEQMESGRMGEWLQNDVLGVLADGTGGVFLRDQNDIAQGLPKAVVAVPEVSYVLGFMPQDLKLDGKYHRLKVTLKDNSEWGLQARRGYFAPQGESGIEVSAEQKPSGTPGSSGLFPFASLPAPHAPQASTPQNVPKPDATAPNIDLATLDSPTTFKVHVNVVLVRVVVRDNNGKVITGLKKEDFQVADNHKPQIISSFSVETPASHVAAVKMEKSETSSKGTPVKPLELPQRFVTLFFDDVHLSIADSMYSQQAATKLLESMQEGDRFSIFTTSGLVEQVFTADRAKLDGAIKRIMGRAQNTSTDCPPMSFYEAYQIIEMEDRSAMQMAIQDVMQCAMPPPQMARSLAQAAAQRELPIGEFQVRQAFGNLDAVIRRMSTLPGQRAIVWVSPGFFVSPSVHDSGDIIDRATKANVVINTLDARGLYVFSSSDASNRFSPSPEKMEFVRTEESMQNEVLEEVADGTGGLFFHDRNDIAQGFVQAAAVPEVSYVLGFTPTKLKLDGKYHQLKVTLVNKQKWSLQARHGYFAPRGESTPEATAEEEVRKTVFSQEELGEMPIECLTQHFSTVNGARLTVVARIDTSALRFRKVEGRNNDKLTLVTAIFDENGNMLKGEQKNIELALKDATREQFSKEGLKFESDFDLQPGTYLVRIVVRDSEGAQMAALNRGVVIP